MGDFPFIIDEDSLCRDLKLQAKKFGSDGPFPHIVLDDFLPEIHVNFLARHFPDPAHPVWLDWRKRSPSQYGKQGPGNSEKFSLLEPAFLLALQEFNSWKFLNYLEALTGITGLLPDPYFTGGGFHQILKGGILDIHTDFNDYRKLNLYRRLNVLIYLNKIWESSYGGCLELWDGGAETGKCVKSIAPVFNRAVIFKTDKQNFHGHPEPWNAPENISRKSVALYYYTSSREEGSAYDTKTAFQGIASKPLPEQEGGL